MKTIIIKELCDDYSLNDIYILSNDFFYEYEKCNPVIFKVGKITESTIKSYFDGFIKRMIGKDIVLILKIRKLLGILHAILRINYMFLI